MPGEVQWYLPLVMWVGEESGRVHKEVQKINLHLPCILDTVSSKGKSTEKTKLYCFHTAFHRSKGRHLYTLDGAPTHLHAALCVALALLLYFMYISPPNTTLMVSRVVLGIGYWVLVKGDKVHINTAFRDNLTKFFADWLGDKVEYVGPKEKLPPPHATTWLGELWTVGKTSRMIHVATATAVFSCWTEIFRVAR